MKNIEYVTTNKNDDVFKILEKNGKTNIKDSNILDLIEVDGIISSKERSDIFITSDFANYNYTNQNSKFYRNVIIKYDNKIMTCDNFDLFSNDNIAIAYGNVIIKDSNSYMKAENVDAANVKISIREDNNGVPGNLVSDLSEWEHQVDLLHQFNYNLIVTTDLCIYLEEGYYWWVIEAGDELTQATWIYSNGPFFNIATTDNGGTNWNNQIS